MDFARCPFGELENCLRIIVGSDEEDIRLVLKQYKSNFVTYELSSSVYTIKDVSEVVCSVGDHDGTLKIEYDDITKRTKPILNPFGGAFGKLRFDERSFQKNLLGVTP